MIRRIEEDSIRPLGAAQVITDLASAVKELIDNSLDANASQITITFLNQGLDEIEVADDGCGVPAEDMSKVGQKSHTSKIKNDLDLYTGNSIGFRGEALHCLAVLSTELTITSRWKDDKSGFGLCLQLSKDQHEGGSEKVVCNYGTTVKICGLLRSLPVRFSEWKRNSKRYFARTIYFLQSYVLAALNTRIRCIHDKQTLFTSSGSGDASKAYVEAFGGGELKSKLTLITASSNRFQAELYFAKTPLRKNGDRQFCFINNRPCELPKVLKKLNEITRLHKWNGFPIIILYLETGELVDYNLTPDKRQMLVPFEEELLKIIPEEFENHISALTSIPVALPTTLASHPDTILDSQPTTTATPIPNSLTLSYTTANSSSQTNYESQRSKVKSEIPKRRACDSICGVESLIEVSLDEKAEQSQAYIVERSDFNRMEIIGQYNCGFILTRIIRPDGVCDVFIIDQHASDERYRLESLERNLLFTTQALVSPVPLNIGLDDAIFIEQELEQLKSLGFNIIKSELPVDQSYERRLLLTSLPFIAGIQLNHTDFLEAIALMRNEEFRGLCSLERVGEALGYKACRSAIMIGDPLNINQMTQVVRNLAGLQKPWICAHGRPTIRLLHTTKLY